VRRLDGPCRVDVGADPGFSNRAVHASYYAAAGQSFIGHPARRHPGEATAKERNDVQAMLFVRLGPLRVLSPG
jgi:hypothetical protein